MADCLLALFSDGEEAPPHVSERVSEGDPDWSMVVERGREKREIEREARRKAGALFVAEALIMLRKSVTEKG